MREIILKTDIRNVLNQVSKLITAKDGTSPCGYGYVLEELAENLGKVGESPQLVDELIEIYCLNEKEISP